MPVVLLVRLRGGRYDAAGSRADRPEWPPHPARVFCALAASACGEDDWAVLQWLEAAGIPEVWASAQVLATARSGYVVTNALHRGKGSQSWPARTNGMRLRVAAVPAAPEFAIAWPAAEPDEASLAALARMSGRVPYVGRSTSPAVVSVRTDLPSGRADWARWSPAGPGAAGTDDLRVPYPGYAERLQAAHVSGRRAREVARTAPYSVAGPAAQPARPGAVPGPFEDLIVFGLERRAARFEGRGLLALTMTLRQALMSRIASDIPAQVSGHGADDRAHVGYLALPDVGHDHADGHILGVALAVPGGMSGPELARLVAAGIDDPIRRLTIRRDYEVAVSYEPFRSAPRGLLADRWTATGHGGARHWVTATPLMLDRHPKRDATEVSEVAWSLRRAGYPEPVSVEVSPAPMIPGAVHRADMRPVRVRGPRRPMLHARVSFDQPVTGPVLAGAFRYFGLGLFVPDRGRP